MPLGDIIRPHENRFTTFKGTITDPIILDTKDKPLTIEVKRTGESTGSINSISQTINNTSSLAGKVITSASFTVDGTQNSELMEFFNSSNNYNLTYKLSDGMEITMNDVRFEPVPELPYESPSNNDYSIREVSGTASWIDPDPFWRVPVPDPSAIKPKKKKVVNKKKKKKTMVPLSEQLKKLGKK